MALKSGRVGIHPSQVDPITGMLLNGPTPGSISFEDLSDSDINNPAVGQTLQYNGTGWENVYASISPVTPATLASLQDVALSSVSDDQILRYNSTANKWENEDMPAIPAAQVNSDWNATSGVEEILNKPTIPAAQVNSDWNATSGVAEILNKPTIPAAQVNSDWNAVSGVAQILNKPTIPAAQVNSDWNAASGVAQILNKPSIPTNVSDLTNGYVWTSGVSASAGATTATITDAHITTNSIIEVFASVQGIQEPTLTVSSGRCVLAFSALAQNTTFKLRITN